MAIGACSSGEFISSGAAASGEASRTYGSGVDRGQVRYLSQRQADASLARFDRAHPQCQLWTNWQKMCSRTGEAGKTYCQTDADRPARPSEPFCVAGAVDPQGPLHANAGDTTQVRASRNRFCARFAGASTDENNPRGLPACQIYRQDRPFNGTSLTAVAHPLCRHWVQRPPLTDGTPSLLFCDSWESHPSCRDIVGVIRPPSLAPNGVIILSSPIPTSVPVWGTYCLPKANSAVDEQVSAARPVAVAQAPAASRGSGTLGKGIQRKLAQRFPGAVLLSEAEFADAIVDRVFRYREVGTDIIVDRPNEVFAAGGKYRIHWLRTISYGSYSIKRGIVSIDCSDCPYHFLNLGWHRIFFRHEGRLHMMTANGRGSVIELIPET
jgi:hypothetical protein